MFKIKVTFTGTNKFLADPIVIAQVIEVSSEVAGDVFADAFAQGLYKTNFMDLTWTYKLEEA